MESLKHFGSPTSAQPALSKASFGHDPPGRGGPEVSVIRLGVAGLGWLGESLIKDVPRVPGLEVAAVQDVVGERAREIASRYDVAWWGTRFDDLLALDDVDAA